MGVCKSCCNYTGDLNYNPEPLNPSKLVTDLNYAKFELEKDDRFYVPNEDPDLNLEDYNVVVDEVEVVPEKFQNYFFTESSPDVFLGVLDPKSFKTYKSGELVLDISLERITQIKSYENQDKFCIDVLYESNCLVMKLDKKDHRNEWVRSFNRIANL